MPARAGLFAALTACHLNAADAMYLGLGNRFIDHAFKYNVLDALASANWNGNAYAITWQVIQEFSDKSAGWLPYSKIREHRDLIVNLLDKPSLKEIIKAFREMEPKDEWLKVARQTALEGSPLSVALAYEQLRRTHHCSLREAFQSELTLSVNCALHGDLQEGVRALLVDKDRQPDWRFKSLDEISAEQINEFFQPPWQDHPLDDL